jgi:phosphatidylcholine synthase
VLYHARLTGQRFAIASVVAILLVSSYHYANVNAMTPDLHFKGFPAFWNVVVFYLFVLDLGAWWNLAIVALFCVLHFVPIKWVAVSRTQRHQIVNALATAGAAGTAIAVVLLLPEPPRMLVWASTACVAWLVIASLLHTLDTREVSA